MTDTTISELEPIIEIIDGSKVLAIEDGIGTFNCTVDDIKRYVDLQIGKTASIATAAGVTTLNALSSPIQIFTGVLTQTVILPDATTLKKDNHFQIINTSTGNVTLNFNGGSLAAVIPSGSYVTIKVLNISTNVGAWILLQNAIISADLTSLLITGSINSITTNNNYSYISKNASNNLIPVIRKTGQILNASTATFLFLNSFPNAITSLNLVTRQASVLQLRHVQLTLPPTTTGFTYRVLDSNGNANTADAVYWSAEGY
jgi:hypothetical protein